MADREDHLFQTPFAGVGEFRFDEKVAQVFPDMIRRSVPGYGQVIGSSALIAKRHAKPNTAIYDLGCSLGATTLAMANQVRTEGCRIIAVDNSEAMLTQVRQTMSDRLLDPLPIEWVCHDIVEMPFEPCSVVALNFTLQFIALEKVCTGHGIGGYSGNVGRPQGERVCPGCVPAFVNDERGSIRHDRVQVRSRRPLHPKSGSQKSGAKQRVLIGMRAGMLCDGFKHHLCAVIGTELDAIHQRQCVHTVDMSIDKTGQHRSTFKLDDLGRRANMCRRRLALTQPSQTVSLERHCRVM